MTGSPNAVATNLSYVLHDRSTSAVVASFASEIERQRRERERQVSQLQRLGADDLARRVILEADVPNLVETRKQTLSIKIGAWRILDALLKAKLPEFLATSHSMFFVDGNDGPIVTRQLFRGSARLALPPNQSQGAGPTYFAVAVLRPSGKEIQLRIVRIDSDAAEDSIGDNGWPRTAETIEKSIREFVWQWDCDRLLWDRPAEETLPEFRGVENRVEGA